jgi:hypothetical protein
VTQSCQEPEAFEAQWAALAVRAGQQLGDLFEAVQQAMARDGCLSAEEVLALVEEALDRLEKGQQAPLSE